MERENFYLLLELGLEPPEQNLSRIEAAIKNKQTEWSKDRNHPTKKRKVQQNLDLIPEIKRVMFDEELRKIEANLAQKLAKQREKEQYEDLDRALKILSSKGYIDEKELTKLTKKFPKLSQKQIRARIRVRITDSEKEKGKGRKKEKKRLDKTTAKQIRGTLSIIHCSSLYHFLDLSPTSSLRVLQDRTKEQDGEIRKIGDKNAETTAKGELIGHCLNWFQNQEKRDMYDATLEQEQLIKLDQQIDIAGFGGKVSPKTYELLVQEALQFGLSKSKAHDYIQDYCVQKKWMIHIPTKSSIDHLQQCGVCGLLSSPSAKNCSGCGYLLKISCPQCDTQGTSTEKNCRGCGFTIGDMPNALPWIQKGKIALGENQLNQALQAFRKSEIYWPQHPEVQPLLQGLGKEKQEQDLLVKQLHQKMNQGHFYEAREVLLKLREKDANHPDLSHESRVNQKIESAEKWLKKGRSSHTEKEIIHAYSQAIQECQDCQGAIQEMSNLPPTPPSAFQFTTTHRAVSLSWKISTSIGKLGYDVLRKEGAPPLHSRDGELLGQTSQTAIEDLDTKSGIFYYYAVFTTRSSISSTKGVVVGPVLRLGEVEACEALPGDRCVNLSWKAPQNATGIEVWREKGETPRQRGKGKKLSSVRLDGVKDSGLSNGVISGYRIIAVYQDEKGKPCYSQGITCQIQPVSPPQPIQDLEISKKNYGLEITWTPPQGDVLLFQSENPFSFQNGENISVKQLSRIGSNIPVQSPGIAQYSQHFQGVIYILPVTVRKEIAIIGKMKRVTSLSEVSKVRGELNSGRLYLEWDWPAGAEKVLIVHRHDRFPQNREDSVQGEVYYTAKQYEQESCYQIRKPEDQDYYFVISVVAENKNETLYSEGVQYLSNLEKALEIYYEIEIQKSLFGKLKSVQLQLHSPHSIENFPEAVLVKKKGNLPLNKTDGSTICEVKSDAEGKKGALNLTIPLQELSKGSYAKLFLNDSRLAQKYRLMAPNKEKLRLF